MAFNSRISFFFTPRGCVPKGIVELRVNTRIYRWIEVTTMIDELERNCAQFLVACDIRIVVIPVREDKIFEKWKCCQKGRSWIDCIGVMQCHFDYLWELFRYELFLNEVKLSISVNWWETIISEKLMAVLFDIWSNYNGM